MKQGVDAAPRAVFPSSLNVRNAADYAADVVDARYLQQPTTRRRVASAAPCDNAAVADDAEDDGRSASLSRQKGKTGGDLHLCEALTGSPWYKTRHDVADFCGR